MGVSAKTKNLLLVKSGGRCEYKGCNKALYQDLVTKKNFNQSYIAHIVADKPGGPRGDKVRSPLLADDVNNLMLLCDTHHRLIDKIEEKQHSESILLEMKKNHEKRIERLTAISPSMDSYIVTYRANVGLHSPNITYDTVREYLIPNFYPAIDYSIELGLVNSPFIDKNKSFWRTEIEALESNFNELLKPKIRKNNISHISLFALAPMPLLIKLGTLLNHIHNVEIHQPVKQPKTWNLIETYDTIEYEIISPNKHHEIVAINLSLSATINNDRITNVLGDDCSIFTITIKNPFNDFLKAKNQLFDFSEKIRILLNEIKSRYEAQTPIHIFPAMPVAIAIELGRAWMPKADMPLIIYDENTANSGFFKALEIKNT